MPYEIFKMRVNAVINRMKGDKPDVRFQHDADQGKHYAIFPDGTRIVGNVIAKNMMVEWGSGHRATATI